MPDHHLLEDEAVLYVQGRLADAERAEFETQLAQSAGLRALVHELEEGSVALAAAMPRRRPPAHVWQQIERTVAEETQRKVVTPSFWTGWLHNGWAAAAACLVGWLSYAIWVNRSVMHPISPVQIASKAASQHGETQTVSGVVGGVGIATLSSFPANAAHGTQADPQSATKEIGVLRWQIVELENHATQLSQALTQHQALLSEPSRVKFYQLVPASNGIAGTIPATPAPELQRALFLAMARELGWSLPTDKTQDANADGQDLQSSQSSSAATNQSRVDIVDLQPATNQTVNTQPASEAASGDVHPQTELVSNDTPDSSAPTNFVPTSAIPVFTASDSVYLAVGSAVAPSGWQLNFWTADGGLSSQFLGTTVIRDDPTVLRISTASLYGAGTLGTSSFASGLNLFVTATSASGQSNSLQFSPPPVTQP